MISQKGVSTARVYDHAHCGEVRARPPSGGARPPQVHRADSPAPAPRSTPPCLRRATHAAGSSRPASSSSSGARSAFTASGDQIWQDVASAARLTRDGWANSSIETTCTARQRARALGCSGWGLPVQDWAAARSKEKARSQNLDRAPSLTRGHAGAVMASLVGVILRHPSRTRASDAKCIAELM